MRLVWISPLLFLALLVAGCDQYLWWDYRDEPYLTALSTSTETEVIRRVASPNKDERQAALRTLAQRAGEARRRGDARTADQFEDIIIRRYLAERDTEVRACVVRICAPLTSPGSRRMVEFLRARIAAGEFPGYAAIALADIAPRIAFNDIEPLTRHPDPGVRYQAAIALTTLADPRGFEPVARVWRGMEMKNWPDKVEGSNLEEARAALAGRAVRSFGRPLY